MEPLPRSKVQIVPEFIIFDCFEIKNGNHGFCKSQLGGATVSPCQNVSESLTPPNKSIADGKFILPPEASVKFCHRIGLTYVSCPPFRVPVARLTASQAAIEEKRKAKPAKKK